MPVGGFAPPHYLLSRLLSQNYVLTCHRTNEPHDNLTFCLSSDLGQNYTGILKNSFEFVASKTLT